MNRCKQQTFLLQIFYRFSEREVESLKQLHEIHGNKWTAIGKEIGRTGQSMQDKFKMLKPERGSYFNVICISFCPLFP